MDIGSGVPGENPHAGQGAVLLDIGDGVGALVVLVPPSLEGQEIEIRPFAAGADSDGPGQGLAHVGVVPRPGPAGRFCSAVFPQLPEGIYEVYLRPVGPVALTVAITGGAVTEASWPFLTHRSERSSRGQGGSHDNSAAEP